MKKIFTLMMAVGSITFLSAQTGFKNDSRSHNDSKSITRVPSGNNSDSYDRNWKDDPNYGMSSRDLVIAINMIEREYAYKIGLVNRDRYLKPIKKTRQINLLEKQKDLEIKQARLKFEKDNRRNTVYNNSKRHY